MNQSAKINQVVELIREELPDLMAVYLYGSQADGSATENSDYDFAILAKQKISFEKLMNLSAALENILKAKIDLIDIITADEVFKNIIISTGVKIFIADSFYVENFENNAFCSYTEIFESRIEIENAFINARLK
jgi:predicted nucleotidyltransferase